MRSSRTAVFGALLLFLACDTGGGMSSEDVALETNEQKASYGIGLQMGQNLVPAADRLDLAALMKGVEDALAEREPALEAGEIEAELQAFSQTIREQQQREANEQAEANAAAGEAFLADNSSKEGVVTTESGLQYEVIREGDGPTPSATDQVTIHYRGTLLDGTEFDSSYERDQPATFSVSGVIPGFAEGLQLMPVGSHYRFWIPGELGYGPAGGGGGSIGPNETLVFEVELLEIPE